MGGGSASGQAGAFVGLARGSYAPPASGGRGGIQPADAELVARLRALVKRHGGWGFRAYYYRLRQLGVVVNHKRLWRTYQLLRLQVGKRRKKKRLPERAKRPLQVPTQPNVCWSLDFRSDALPDGRRFRALNAAEDGHREVLGTEVDFSLPATRVVALLTTLVSRPGTPARIRADNGPELIRQVLQTWCQGQGIDLQWIQPASPPQNAYIERFNGSFRRELLNAYLLASLRQVREQCLSWQYDYNHLRPHQALSFLTPIEFRQAA